MTLFSNVKLAKYFKSWEYLFAMYKYRNCSKSKYISSLSRLYSVAPSEYNLQVLGKSLKNYITSLEKEYQSLSNDVSKTSVSRKRELLPVIRILKERNTLLENLKNLAELFNSNDEDLKKLAEQEKEEFENKIKELDSNLLLELIPKDKEESFDSLILEIQAGVGGQEAMLFAKEIFDMYQKFAAYKGWEYIKAEYLSTDIGGIRGATAIIKGLSVFQYLRHEAGIHRVQRIPSTEKSGRIHTSTISVIVLPQPSEIEININPKDLRIEVKRSSGAGGQHVNKTESAVRIVHIPTAIAVECQEDRSQIRNRKIAMAKLSALLYNQKITAQQAEENASRKNQVKTRNRNEKIRTYNFKDDRVTDHRIGVNYSNLKSFFEGETSLDNLIQQLDEKYKLDNLLNLVNNTE